MWLTNLFVSRLDKTTYWEGVLAVGTRYCDDDSRNTAKYHLQTGEGRCSPARMVAIARRWSIPEWLEPAFRTLIKEDPSKISLADTHFLGLETFHSLFQVRGQIHQFRLSLLWHIPAVVHAPGCSSATMCKSKWEEIYMAEIKILAHPLQWHSTGSVLQTLEMEYHGIAEMGNGQCLEATCTELWGTAFTVQENDIMNKGIQERLIHVVEN